MSEYIDELIRIIRIVHGADARYLESVSVTETASGETIWDGIVEVFELIGHPMAHRVYAWAFDTGDPRNPRRHVTILHLHPVKSARDAVRAAIAHEHGLRGPEE